MKHFGFKFGFSDLKDTFLTLKGYNGVQIGLNLTVHPLFAIFAVKGLY